MLQIQNHLSIMAAGSALVRNSITFSDIPLQVNALAGNATAGNRKGESIAILIIRWNIAGFQNSQIGNQRKSHNDGHLKNTL